MQFGDLWFVLATRNSTAVTEQLRAMFLLLEILMLRIIHKLATVLLLHSVYTKITALI